MQTLKPELSILGPSAEIEAPGDELAAAIQEGVWPQLEAEAQHRVVEAVRCTLR